MSFDAKRPGTMWPQRLPRLIDLIDTPRQYGAVGDILQLDATGRRMEFVSPSQVLFAQVVDVTVEDTIDETSLLGSGRGTKTLAAGVLDQGSVIVIVGHGYLSTTGTPTLAVKAKLGGSEVCGTGAVTLNNGVTDVGFTFRVEISCRSTGAVGTVVAEGTFEYDDDSEHKLVKTSATTVDTTGALPVDVTADWGTALAANTITCQVALIELVEADYLAVAAPSGLSAVAV